jgi:cation diffusion facilitator family transporter
MSEQANSVRAVVYAFGANFAIALAKSVAAWVTGSSAMLAEAVHSYADTANQGLLFLGLFRANKEPTRAHPLGFGKELYFWSFIVAIMLFTVGGMFSLYEGWHKWSQPETMEKPIWAIGVLLFAILAEGASFLGCLREVRREQGEQSLLFWFRSSRQSALLVVFGEDLAALLGLLLALAAIGFAWLLDMPQLDALGSMAIGLLLLVVATLVGMEVKALLIGESMDPRREAELEAFLQQQPEVERVFRILTQQMGPHVMLAVKAKMRSEPSADALVDAINRVEKRVKTSFPEIRWSFFEPDVTDD